MLLLLAIYPGCLHQQDGHHVINIIFLLFPLHKGHMPENLWYRISGIFRVGLIFGEFNFPEIAKNRHSEK